MRTSALFLILAFMAVTAYGVDELHSFDRDLLRLDRHPRIDGLHICKPSAPQKTLAL